MSEALASLTQEVDLRTVRGLSQAEVARRLATEGYTELPAARPRSLLAIAAGVLREPMVLLLVAAGTLYVFLGDLAEALLLISSIFLIVGVNLYQERRTERALEALRDLASPRALVIRDGAQARIPGREVVRGDVLVLVEGDRVPADAVLLAGLNLSADESLLTGESVPVRKVAGCRVHLLGRQGVARPGTMGRILLGGRSCCYLSCTPSSVCCSISPGSDAVAAPPATLSSSRCATRCGCCGAAPSGSPGVRATAWSSLP